jgi:predicted kinase
MNKNRLSHPTLIYMYGLPGSGKTFVARQLCDELGLAHISGERIRYELFENPKHDKTEYQIVTHLMDYMAEQFLNTGVSVVYDISVNRLADRRVLRDLAKRFKAKEVMLWLQIDPDTAWTRTQSRDHRKIDDKYAPILNQEHFEKYMRSMQNPQNEHYLVLSGKHLFNSQKSAIIRRLVEMGSINQESLNQVIAKPELVNLVNKAQNQAGRVDYSRRNVIIR